MVLVEWNNVTAGPDKDIDWWMSGDHFIREGYAYVSASVQQMGVQSMKDWSPERYGSLDVTNGGKVDKDDLSFDIFSAVGRDEYGNALGGSRLAAHEVPTAKNSGMNPGTYRFCRLYGSHEPFDEDTLNQLYPSHEAYVKK